MLETLKVVQPVCEYGTDPLGIDVLQPGISDIREEGDQVVVQLAAGRYHFQVQR